jgi:nitrogen regulatory protein PII
MKLVVAVIRPEKLKAIQLALKRRGIEQMTVSDVVGTGHQRGEALIYRSSTIHETWFPRARLEIAVADDLVDSAVEAILLHGRTGEVGDGMILIHPLDQFVRIRTGEAAHWPPVGKRPSAKRA